MKSLFKFINLAKFRRSIPKSWHGQWKDEYGRKLIIKGSQHGFYVVTVLDPNGQPYEIDLLENKKKKTLSLTSRFTVDTDKNPILQVEAGSKNIGPTYDLHFLSKDKNDSESNARNSDDIDRVYIKTNVGMGLYNDWEDDLGVPWAFPLSIYHKVKDNL
jgi:hypothetical protein